MVIRKCNDYHYNCTLILSINLKNKNPDQTGCSLISLIKKAKWSKFMVTLHMLFIHNEVNGNTKHETAEGILV